MEKIVELINRELVYLNDRIDQQTNEIAHISSNLMVIQTSRNKLREKLTDYFSYKETDWQYKEALQFLKDEVIT